MQNKPEICAVIQARLSSTRLPGKILKPLGDKTILERVIERVSRIKGLDSVVVAIPDNAEHDELERAISGFDKSAFGTPVSCVRGSEDNVLDRTLKAARSVGAGILMRITSDCPFVDPKASGDLLESFLESGVDYARFNSEKGYPLGFDTEVARVAALETAMANNPDDFEREHATPYVWRRPEQFKTKIITGSPDHRDWRLVIDESRDYEFAKALYSRLEKRAHIFTYDDICDVLTAEPELLDINRDIKQKAMIGRKDESTG